MWITCIIQLSTTNQQPMTYDNGFISSSSSYLLLPWWSRDSYDKLSPWHIPGVRRVSLPKLHKVEGTALIHSLSSMNRGRHTKIYMHRALLHPPKFIRLDLEGAVESFRMWPCLTDFLIQLFYNCFFFRPWGHLSDLSIHSARPTDTSLRPAPTPSKAARQDQEAIRSQDKRDVQCSWTQLVNSCRKPHKHVLDKICDSPHGRGENEHIPTMADWYYLRMTKNYEFVDLRVQNRSVKN